MSKVDTMPKMCVNCFIGLIVGWFVATFSVATAAAEENFHFNLLPFIYDDYLVELCFVFQNCC